MMYRPSGEPCGGHLKFGFAGNGATYVTARTSTPSFGSSSVVRHVRSCAPPSGMRSHVTNGMRTHRPPRVAASLHDS